MSKVEGENGNSLSGHEKAAILLLSLGEDVASQVFSKLGEGEIAKLGKVMASMSNVSTMVKDSVLDEFVDQIADVALLPEGGQFIKTTILKALGNEKGKVLVEDLENSRQGSLSEIKHLNAKTLSQFVRNEHPQTIAMILAHLEPFKSSEVMSYFPIDIKKDVLMRIATLEGISPDAIAEVEEVLTLELKSLGNQYGEKLGGTHAAAEILNQMDKSTEGSIMEKMDEEDPDLAGNIRELMFIFEDINGVDDRGIQTLLKDVSNEQLVMALKTASDELKDKIFRNVSERAAEMMKEDMESMGPVKLTDVETAQTVIVNIVRKLEDQGKIVIGGKGGDDMVV